MSENTKKSFFLGLNWKMNPDSLQKAEQLFLNYPENIDDLTSVIFPPSVYLSSINSLDSSKNYLFGLQDISTGSEGAFTGDISATMAKFLDCKYTLVGHSETRDLHKLDNIQINQKLLQAVNNSLIPVLCIGYQKDKTALDINYTELSQQIQITLQNVPNSTEIVIAYEPVWAIGTGKVASEEIILEVFRFIRSQDILQNQTKLQIIYGGSVNENNIESLAKINDLDGFLIGSAALDANKVQKMLEILQRYS